MGEEAGMRAKTHLRPATKISCRRGASEQSAQDADDTEHSRYRCRLRKTDPARGWPYGGLSGRRVKVRRKVPHSSPWLQYPDGKSPFCDLEHA
jgi:hypothetical protein